MERAVARVAASRSPPDPHLQDRLHRTREGAILQPSQTATEAIYAGINRELIRIIDAFENDCDVWFAENDVDSSSRFATELARAALDLHKLSVRLNAVGRAAN